ncbi:hypothetical protein MYOV011v1_p0337 [Vibrio phage 6E35.1a]|nr:hypothetical protein MYOV011v1_p0337 [Vibrio phage 6E35.1a]
MSIEIERKWLVTPEQYRHFVSNLLNAEKQQIQQRYLRRKECVYSGGAFYIFPNHSGYDTVILRAPEGCPDLSGQDLRKLGARVRLYTPSNEGEFTIKLPIGKGVKHEINIKFDAIDLIVDAAREDYEARDTAATGFIHKIRWSEKVDDIQYDCDRFKNRPYRIIEAEFKSIEAANEYEPCFDYIREVTDDKAFANKNMAFALNELDILKHNIEIFCKELDDEATYFIEEREDVSYKTHANQLKMTARKLRLLTGNDQ